MKFGIHAIIVFCVVLTGSSNLFGGGTKTPSLSSSVAGGALGKYPPVEPVMREIQVRWNFYFTTNYNLTVENVYLSWGESECGGLVPFYPSDGYFNNSDPDLFVKNVARMVENVYWGGELVDGDGNHINGRSPFPNTFVDFELFKNDGLLEYFLPESTSECNVEINSYGGNSVPYISSENAWDTSATVNIYNAGKWLEKIQGDLSRMTAFQLLYHGQAKTRVVALSTSGRSLEMERKPQNYDLLRLKNMGLENSSYVEYPDFVASGRRADHQSIYTYSSMNISWWQYWVNGTLVTNDGSVGIGGSVRRSDIEFDEVESFAKALHLTDVGAALSWSLMQYAYLDYYYSPEYNEDASHTIFYSLQGEDQKTELIEPGYIQISKLESSDFINGMLQLDFTPREFLGTYHEPNVAVFPDKIDESKFYPIIGEDRTWIVDGVEYSRKSIFYEESLYTGWNIGRAIHNSEDDLNVTRHTTIIVPDFTIPESLISSQITGCSQGETCKTSAGGDYLNSCISLQYSLGKTVDGDSIGSLRLYSLTPSVDHATPKSLSLYLNPDLDDQPEAIKDGGGNLQQIRTVHELVDIQVDSTNDYRYQIHRYRIADIDVDNKVDGLYVVLPGKEDAWTWEYTIENPDYPDQDGELSDFNRLLVTEVNEGNYANAKCVIYDYDEPSSTWRMGVGYDRDASGPAWDFSSQVAEKWQLNQELNNGETVIRQTLDKDFNVVSYSKAIYTRLAGSMPLLEVTYGQGANAQTYRNVYYDDETRDGAKYGKLKYTIDPNGHWVRYEYDDDGNMIKTIEQIGNLPITADESQCIVTTSLNDGDGTSITYQGVETSRSYQFYDDPVDGFRTIRNIQCVQAGAGPDDPTNLVTTTWLYYGGDQDGEVYKIVYPDGRVSFSENEEYNDQSTDVPYNIVIDTGCTLTVTRSGTPDDPTTPTQVIKGTEALTYTNADGQDVWYNTYDIESGVLISSNQNTEYDAYGRVIRSDDLLRGTYSTSSYGCCHLDATQDEMGITTTYGYDALGRQETVTRLGITHYTTYDVADRTRTQSRISTDAKAVTLNTQSYDILGRLTSSTDSAGNTTTYTYTTDSQGRRVETITNPDTSTIANTYNQDGTLYKSSGSANATTFYEYGTAVAPIENTPTLQCTKVIHMGDGGAMTQWEMTFTDMMGRTVCTVYSDATPEDLTDNPISRLYYDNTPESAGGRLIRSVDPDGITTLYGYNEDGDQDVTAIDLNDNDTIDYADDRITKSVSYYQAQGTYTAGLDIEAVRRTESYVWAANDATATDGTLTHYSESTIDGYHSWSVSIVAGQELVTHTETTMQRKYEEGEVDGQDAQDARNEVITTNPDGSYSVSVTINGYLASTTSYDANDAILTQQTYAYDEHGRQFAVTDLRTASSGSTTYTYNDADQIVAVTTVDPDGDGPLTAQTTRFTYDEMGRQTKIELPDGTYQHRKYTLRGQLAKSWGADGYPVEYTYDTQGRRKTLTTWKNFNQSTGNGVSGKAVTTWQYDPYRGDMIQKTYDDGKGTTYTHMNSGRLKTRTWARGITTTYSYSDAGELLGVDYSDDTQDITYTYDRLGRRSMTIDAAGLTEYTYVDDVHNTATSMTVSASPSSITNTLAGTQVSYAYDDPYKRRSNVIVSRMVDSTMTAFATTNYTYDAASRLKTVDDDVNVATYNYLAYSGNMIDNVVYGVTTAPDEVTTVFTTSKTYDQLGRFVSHETVRAGDSAILSIYGYTYNQRSQRAQAQMTDGSYWDYQYDHLGQLTGAAKFSVDGNILPGYQYNYQYDQIGNRTQASSGGNQFGLNLRDTAYTSNSLNQYTQINNHPYTNITGQAHKNATVTVQLDSNQPILPGSNGATATDGTLILPTTRIPMSDTSDDAYFNAELQVDITSGGGTSGARTELSATVTGVRNNQGAGNDQDAIDTKSVTRQIPATVVSPTYDDDGNITSDDRWTYTWNGENRLIKLEPKSIYTGDGSQPDTKSLEFKYDSTGRRIEKRVYSYNTTTQQQDTLESITRFLYDGWLLIAELNKPTDEQSESVGSPLRTYTHGLDLSGSMQGAGGIAGLLFAHVYDTDTQAQQVALAYCYDGNGNVIDLVTVPTPTEIASSVQSEIVGNYEYSPFGKIIRASGEWAELSPFQFSTKYADKETGQYYYGYRYFDVLNSRWMSCDPAEEAGGLNLYAIHKNNSVEFADMLGMFEIEFEGKKWSEKQKKDIKESLPRIKKRCEAVVEQVENAIDKLNEKPDCCENKFMIERMETLVFILNQCIKMIDGKKNWELRHKDLGAEENAQGTGAFTRPSGFKKYQKEGDVSAHTLWTYHDAETWLNDGISPNWTEGGETLDTILFHEMTHLVWVKKHEDYPRDDDVKGIVMNSHKIDDLYKKDWEKSVFMARIGLPGQAQIHCKFKKD